MRYDLDGKEIADFILNADDYKNSKILVTGDNFGCGSSREHAPWALLDFGIKCIIAPSFADIFYNNCFKNGILPIKLDNDKVSELMKLAKQTDNNFVIDLPKQEIRAGNKIYKFDLDSFRKECLIDGLDDIGLTLKKENRINQFELKNKQELPWLHKRSNA